MNRPDEAHTAVVRFGMGPQPGEVALARSDPRQWLREQLVATPAPDSAFSAMPPSRQTLAEFQDYRAERAKARKASGSQGRADEKNSRAIEAIEKAYRKRSRAQRNAQLIARATVASMSKQPFRERLVRLWSNHFTVSSRGKRELATSCLAFENEAIRAHLDGHFHEMLRAVARHPVMLIYLDNHRSVGPRSRAGTRRKRGLNENLARELLELHTLGVDGGYGQSDVLALAKIITGWTVADGKRDVQSRSQFRFVAARHEPGAHVLLGRRYAEDGVAQGEQALRDLARHPSTARFIATKLSRHFIADDPPAAAVDVLAQTFMDSDGHLPTVHAKLIDIPSAWSGDERKLKSPEELLISMARGLQPLPDKADGTIKRLMAPLRTLGQLPFAASSPAGWPDVAEHWGAPGAVLKRVEWAINLGRRLGNRHDAAALVGEMVPDASTALTIEVARAESRGQALGLMLASPDFQWR